MEFKKNIILSLLLLFTISSLGLTLMAQEKPQSEEEQKMMKLWMEYATPGENHKYLEQFTGDWNTTAKMWMKPGAEPEVSQGITTSKMLMGGRYLKSYYKGTMMGMPFEGISLTGYDNFKKKFTSIWFDNAGTGFYTTSGTLDKDKKIRTETGLWDDFTTGSQTKVRWVTTIIDKNKYIFEMFDTNAKTGKEVKSGEIVYTRKK